MIYVSHVSFHACLPLPVERLFTPIITCYLAYARPTIAPARFAMLNSDTVSSASHFMLRGMQIW